jgi:hypothetical protein
MELMMRLTKSAGQQYKKLKVLRLSNLYFIGKVLNNYCVYMVSLYEIKFIDYDY